MSEPQRKDAIQWLSGYMRQIEAIEDLIGDKLLLPRITSSMSC